MNIAQTRTVPPCFKYENILNVMHKKPKLTFILSNLRATIGQGGPWRLLLQNVPFQKHVQAPPQSSPAKILILWLIQPTQQQNQEHCTSENDPNTVMEANKC